MNTTFKLVTLAALLLLSIRAAPSYASGSESIDDVLNAVEDVERFGPILGPIVNIFRPKETAPPELDERPPVERMPSNQIETTEKKMKTG